MTEEGKSIRLRGHHLICLHFFQGKGYHPEFVENLTHLLNKAQDGDMIKVHSGPDDVCKQCPYLRNRICSFSDNAEAEIQDMDRTALELLQISTNEQFHWDRLKDKIPGIFETWVEKYCTSCSWKAVCTVSDAKKQLAQDTQMNELKVNYDEVQKAMEDISRDTFDYFLDTQTGEVITFSEEILNELKNLLYDEDYEEMADEIEYIEFDQEPEMPDWMFDEADLALEILLDSTSRYIRIPERNSDTAFSVMKEFVQTVRNRDLQKKLLSALNGRGAFRRFKDILMAYPKERKRWHGYNAKASYKEISDWLHAHGIKSAS